MPSSIFWGLQHINHNVLCAIDIKCTGRDPDRHHIGELCILPLDHMLNTHPELLLCHLRIQPPEGTLADVDFNVSEVTRSDMAKAMLQGFNEYKAIQIVQEWFHGLKLLPGKKIIPLVYNWTRDRPFLSNWLGHDLFSELFAEEVRDVLSVAQFLNDRLGMKAEPVPFSKTSLAWIAKQFNVRPIQTGQVSSNALMVADVYKCLLKTLLY